MHPEEIKAAMRMAGVTPAMLADEMKVAAASVSQAIHGQIRSVRIQSRIAQIIGKPLKVIWPSQVTLRRTRREVDAQRAAGAAA